MDNDSGCALNEWLDDYGCDLFAVCFQDVFGFFEAIVQALLRRAIEAIGKRHRGEEGFEQQRSENGMEQADAAETDRADSVAVVGIFESDEFCSLFLACVLEILVCDLESDLDGGCAAVGIEDFFEVFWCDGDEFFGEFDRSCLGEAQQCAVSNFAELGFYCVVDFFDIVAVEVAPER